MCVKIDLLIINLNETWIVDRQIRDMYHINEYFFQINYYKCDNIFIENIADLRVIHDYCKHIIILTSNAFKKIPSITF